jgi:hypothetical protein
MKPLVLWCRWHDATLRLRGRDETAVWGELVYGEGEETERFRFDLNSWELILGHGDNVRSITLDEMGVEGDA